MPVHIDMSEEYELSKIHVCRNRIRNIYTSTLVNSDMVWNRSGSGPIHHAVTGSLSLNNIARPLLPLSAGFWGIATILANSCILAILYKYLNSVIQSSSVGSMLASYLGCPGFELNSRLPLLRQFRKMCTSVYTPREGIHTSYCLCASGNRTGYGLKRHVFDTDPWPQFCWRPSPKTIVRRYSASLGFISWSHSAWHLSGNIRLSYM